MASTAVTRSRPQVIMLPAARRSRAVTRSRGRALVGRAAHRAKNMKIPLAVLAGFAPGANRLWQHKGSVEDLTNEASRIYLGYTPWNGNWDWHLAMLGTGPIILGALAHKFIGNGLGINRMLDRAHIPLFRF